MPGLPFKCGIAATVLLILSPTIGFGQDCVVIGPGTWTGRQPSEFWSLPHAMRLAGELESAYVGKGLDGRDGWRLAEIQVDRLRWESERGWSWVKPAQDSLVILRPAMLSEGIGFRLAGPADTLLGRAYAFSDAVSRTNPRANAYGVRYDCGNEKNKEAALAAYRLMKENDAPDAGRGAAEDSLRWEEIQRRLKAEHD